MLRSSRSRVDQEIRRKKMILVINQIVFQFDLSLEFKSFLGLGIDIRSIVKDWMALSKGLQYYRIECQS